MLASGKSDSGLRKPGQNQPLLMFDWKRIILDEHTVSRILLLCIKSVLHAQISEPMGRDRDSHAQFLARYLWTAQVLTSRAVV
ncbi:hypothetical protein QTG54_009637 [Skeletonema marinoi]|uniref:Uncharacterized protein n=1 Tax=Skeletonema marinoi TaxID=267567 RepID=A0AAD8Y624_9STRA|nr:hypothetical protein QTG54_009637 [Skeletonema marinoi]